MNTLRKRSDNSIRKWDLRFLRLAKEIATWSKDPSTQVGAVIVRTDRTIASMGFNGFPRYMNDAVELYAEREIKYQRVIHAEMNAMLAAAEKIDGCTLYTWPLSPCDRCIVHIIQVGIIRVVAPAPSPEAQTRWGPALERTAAFCQEAQVEHDLYVGLN